jgi:hypothetical protein
VGGTGGWVVGRRVRGPGRLRNGMIFAELSDVRMGASLGREDGSCRPLTTGMSRGGPRATSNWWPLPPGPPARAKRPGPHSYGPGAPSVSPSSPQGDDTGGQATTGG